MHTPHHPHAHPYAEHADLVDTRVHVRTTGTTTATCYLRAPRTPQEDHYVLDVGSGVELLVHPDQIEDVSTAPQEETPQAPPGPDGQHQLNQFQQQVTDRDWADSRAVHEAAHAVIGQIVGMQVETAWVAAAADRDSYVGGEVTFTGPHDVHLAAVHQLAGPMAHARRVGEIGYSRLTQAAVETLGGQGDHSRIEDRVRRGWVIWRSQAQRDAQTLLDTPAVWQAIRTVGAALLERQSLDDADIRALIGDPAALSDHRLWHPNNGE